MTHRVLALTLVNLACLAAFTTASTQAQAQGLKPSLPRATGTGVTGATGAASAVVPVAQQPADFIVAIVNSEPISNWRRRAAPSPHATSWCVPCWTA
jgi:hypothetical protein